MSDIDGLKQTYRDSARKAREIYDQYSKSRFKDYSLLSPLAEAHKLACLNAKIVIERLIDSNDPDLELWRKGLAIHERAVSEFTRFHNEATNPR